MFIPLEGENIICLANVTAIYRSESQTVILKRDGTTETTSFTPLTLAKRQRAFAAESAVFLPPKSKDQDVTI
ncbi:MAG: hypothetical protein MR000_06440 [Cloacibacillus porcorum]|uniref:hypothetical protein n=1 Tax=Cloacibacillus porcorum TaxID=1197717 RepID=UPI0023563921|nr:hypothetical protein [Cloacibacillus porcorum]MCI5864847.1 hypothetical protein [Cloacibacillus porcorum]MDD7648510.1 hypothetical protein [Cloacibacillus porcorum]MDY4092761.1 hypothetical protein [Cloacibacillus porcorum]